MLILEKITILLQLTLTFVTIIHIFIQIMPVNEDKRLQMLKMNKQRIKKHLERARAKRVEQYKKYKQLLHEKISHPDTTPEGTHKKYPLDHIIIIENAKRELKHRRQENSSMQFYFIAIVAILFIIFYVTYLTF